MTIFTRIYPRGWADLSVATACQLQQTNVIDCVDVAAHRISAARLKAGAQDIETCEPTFTNTLAKVILPVYASAARHDARTQTSVDEASTACALERYYLDHHAYPSSLGELVPTYLPRVPPDVIDGAPLRYQQTPDGRFRLWAVGWNGQDEGGRVFWKNAANHKLDDERGDWVWQYEALVPSEEKP